MRPVLLHLDDALLAQEGLAARAEHPALDARDIGPALRLWSRPGALEALRLRLGEIRYDATRPEIFFYGSGDFHHVALMLIARALNATGRPATVLHFDNHPDWVKFENGLHCGSWAARAARLPQVKRLITMGPCSPDIERPTDKGADLSVLEDNRLELYPYRARGGQNAIDLGGRTWSSIESLGPEAFGDLLLERIPTDDVYVTIDKDVLAAADAATNWDQGEIRLYTLLYLLTRVREHHRIVGADVVGDWSAPDYGPDLLSSLLKRGEALMDQPWGRPHRDLARRINEAGNLRLLDFFVGAA